ncbi:MAG: hypothetical protein V3T86_08115 [Planctomycetota bacterium]
MEKQRTPRRVLWGRSLIVVAIALIVYSRYRRLEGRHELDVRQLNRKIERLNKDLAKLETKIENLKR